LDMITKINSVVGVEGIKNLIRLYMEFNSDKSDKKKVVKKVIKKVIKKVVKKAE